MALPPESAGDAGIGGMADGGGVGVASCMRELSDPRKLGTRRAKELCEFASRSAVLRELSSAAGGNEAESFGDSETFMPTARKKS